MAVSIASRGEIIFLNETAQTVLNVINSFKGIHQETLIDEIASQYFEDIKTIQNDINTYVDMLIQYEVLYEDK